MYVMFYIFAFFHITVKRKYFFTILEYKIQNQNEDW